MDYRVVFDSTREGPPGIALPIVGFFVAGFCGLLWAFRRQIISTQDPAAAAKGRRMLLLFLVASTLFTIGTAISSYQAHQDGPARLTEGRIQVVEGTVEGFQPERTGHDRARFTVNGVRFSYSSFIFGHGFNRSNLVGGPIREGLRVRVHYTRCAWGEACNDIQRLEISE